jgi:hypothetical protein
MSGAFSQFGRKEGYVHFSPMHIHPNIEAKRNGPGPKRALIYKKKTLPKKRKTAKMTVGY